MGALQGWLDAVSIADVLVSLVWIGGLLVALRWLKPVLEGMRSIAEDWRGTPARPGRAAVPGVMEQLAAHATSIEEIRYHTQPNHGGSAYDALKQGQDEMREMLVGALSELGMLRRIAARQHPDDPDLT